MAHMIWAQMICKIAKKQNPGRYMFSFKKGGYCCAKDSPSECPIGATNPLQRFDSGQKVNRDFDIMNHIQGRIFRYVFDSSEVKKTLKWRKRILK